MLVFWEIAYVQRESAWPAPGWMVGAAFLCLKSPFWPRAHEVGPEDSHDIHIFVIAKILLIRKLLLECRLYLGKSCFFVAGFWQFPETVTSNSHKVIICPVTGFETRGLDYKNPGNENTQIGTHSPVGDV